MGLLLPGFVIFRLGEKVPSGKSNGDSCRAESTLGLQAYNNVEDKTKSGRDSVGF